MERREENDLIDDIPFGEVIPISLPDLLCFKLSCGRDLDDWPPLSLTPTPPPLARETCAASSGPDPVTLAGAASLFLFLFLFFDKEIDIALPLLRLSSRVDGSTALSERRGELPASLASSITGTSECLSFMCLLQLVSFFLPSILAPAVPPLTCFPPWSSVTLLSSRSSHDRPFDLDIIEALPDEPRKRVTAASTARRVKKP